MYIAVCDDLAQERRDIEASLERWSRLRRVPLRCRVFASASDLLDAARTEGFTLYLLDIMMPGIDGLTTARELRTFDETGQIVFLTTSPGFAYESYGVGARDYLLKPVADELLFSILDKLHLEEQKPQEGLVVRVGTSLIRILFSRLSAVEVRGKHLYFYLYDGTVHEVTGALREVEPLLMGQTSFVRTHRACLVNLLHVSELSPAGAVLFSGQTLPVSRLLYTQVQEQYLKVLFSGREEAVE